MSFKWVVVILWAAVSCTAFAASSDLDQAWSLYNSGDYDQAYEVFSRLVKENPESEPANFGLGLSAYRRGKLSHARFAFERVLMINAKNHRARLELARTSMAMEQYDIAQEEFERVLDFNPPAQVRTNVERFLGEIRRRNKPWSYAAQASVTAFHDDNANFGPSSRIISTLVGDLEVASNSTPVEAWGMALGAYGGATYDPGQKQRWMLSGGVMGYQNWMDEATQQEITFLRLQAGPKYVGRQFLLDVPLKTDYMEYGHETLVNIFGGEPSLLVVAGESWQHLTQTRLEYRHYRDGSHRDGPVYRAAQTLKRLVGSDHHSISLTAGYTFEDCDAPGYRNYGPEIALAGEYNILESVSLYASAEFRLYDYAERQWPDLQTEDREDEQLTLVAGARYSLSDRWGADFNYRRVENKSTFDLYEYDRNVFSLSTFVWF